MSRFGEPTDTMLRDAYIDSRLYGWGSLKMEQRVLLTLRPGDWVSAPELVERVSHRFGGYLHTLKERGVEWEKRLDPDRPKGKMWYQYRLTPTGEQSNLFN